MSRSGYIDGGDSDDDLRMGRWRGIIASATRGKRGQQFFRDLVAALDAMPEKRLASGELQDKEGAVCALGALGKHRGVELGALDTYDHEALGKTFNVAEQLTQEVMYTNDEAWPGKPDDTGQARWQQVRAWAARQIVPTEAELELTSTAEGSP